MLRLLPVMLLFALAGTHIDAQLSVWTLTTTQHVLRSQPAGVGADPHVYAARNEWVSFQILVRSDTAERGLNVTPGIFTGPQGARLPSGAIQLYREHQVQITTPSYRNADFHADRYPDALIPFTNPITGQPLRGGRFQAVPFDLPAQQTHAFWVDIFIAADTRPGTYTGTVTMTADGQPPAPVQATLTVWNFTLPETFTCHTCFGKPALQLRTYYTARAKAGMEAEPKDWTAVNTQCDELQAENHIDATPPACFDPSLQKDGTYVISDARIAEFRDFVDRYHLTSYQVPHPRYYLKDPYLDRAQFLSWAQAWTDAIKKLNRPQVLFFIYLKDEPNDLQAYQYIQRWGAAVRETHSPLKVLVTKQTEKPNPAWGTLNGAVDIWCPLFPLYDQATWEQRYALGDMSWCYTALCNGNPNPWWEIDFPLLNYRVPAWMAWRQHMTGLLYWGDMMYWKQVDDPWLHAPVDIKHYGGKDVVFNGEGSLLYPARALGYDGFTASIRLKALRDSLQDYEYLAMLDRQGKRDAAEKIIDPLVPSWFHWNTDPAAYDQAKQQLAALIMQP